MSNNKYDLWQHDPATNIYIAQRHAERVTRLPGGLYQVYRDQWGNPTATKLDIRSDPLCCVKSAAFGILDEIKTFWSKAEEYKAMGLTHKRGILLEGPAGCGKSVITQMAVSDIVEKNGVAFTVVHIGIGTDQQFVSQVRQIQPDVPILYVLEDIDQYVEECEDALLNMLDGTAAIGGSILFLATTNNLEKIPARIRHRPSRIDKVVHVGYPDEHVRRDYIKFLAREHKLSQEHLMDLEMGTDRMGFAEIKDIVVSMVIYGRKIADVLEDARARRLLREKV